MVQSILTTILFIAGVAIFLYAPITVFLGQKRGNWDMSTKRMLSYLGLSQLGITIALIAWVLFDFGTWTAAILFFLFFAAFHLLQFTTYWLQMRWLARIAKKLRKKPHWL
jgi:O-antigen/teichoic acid export membrane protein